MLVCEKMKRLVQQFRFWRY